MIHFLNSCAFIRVLRHTTELSSYKLYKKPKVRDLLAIERIEGEALKEVALITNLTSTPKQAIEDLCIKDYVEIQKVLKDFLSPLEERS